VVYVTYFTFQFYPNLPADEISLTYLVFPVFNTKIETQQLGERICQIFQAENQGHAKDFGVTDRP
jgi:hypothetical protein